MQTLTCKVPVDACPQTLRLPFPDVQPLAAETLAKEGLVAIQLVNRPIKDREVGDVRAVVVVGCQAPCS